MPTCTWKTRRHIRIEWNADAWITMTIKARNSVHLVGSTANYYFTSAHDAAFSLSANYGRHDYRMRTLYFCPVVTVFLFYSSSNLSGRRLDVYHTSTHDVALVRI